MSLNQLCRETKLPAKLSDLVLVEVLEWLHNLARLSQLPDQLGVIVMCFDATGLSNTHCGNAAGTLNQIWS